MTPPYPQGPWLLTTYHIIFAIADPTFCVLKPLLNEKQLLLNEKQLSCNSYILILGISNLHAIT